MQRPQPGTLVKRTPRRLAVNGDLRHRQPRAERLHPTHKAERKSPRIDSVEDPLQCVVRRNALAQTEKALEPGRPLLGKKLDLPPVITIGDDAADGDNQNVDQPMLRTSAHARILERDKVIPNRNLAETGHGTSPCSVTGRA